MARSPIYSAQTRLRWSETWLDDSKVAVDLTNPDTSAATITLRILDAAGVVTAGTGTVTPVDMKNGKFKYQVKPVDFTFPATFTDPPTKFNCQYVCTYANGEILDGDFFLITCLKSI